MTVTVQWLEMHHWQNNHNTSRVEKVEHNQDYTLTTNPKTHLDWVGEVLFVAVIIDFLK